MPIQTLFPLGFWKDLSYFNNILALSPIRYWPLDDPLGAVSARELVTQDNGTYNNVTLGQAGLIGNAASFNGTNSYVNVYSAALAAAFPSGEHTLCGFFKPADSGVWGDGVSRRLWQFNSDASNRSFLNKFTTGGEIDGLYASQGATTRTPYIIGLTTTGWSHIALQVSRTRGDVRVYLDGQLTTLNAIQAGTLNAWPGSLASNLCLIGAATTTPATVWKGSLQHVSILPVISAADLAITAARHGQVLFDGDSRSYYTHETAIMADTAVTAKKYGASIYAVSGSTITAMIARSAAVDALYRSKLNKNIVVVWCGVNESGTAAALWSLLQTYCNARRSAGFKVILCTEIDCQDATRNASGWHTTTYPTLNGLIRAGWASCADGLADLGADSKLQDATNTTYFQADKVHLTTSGYNIVAGVIAPVLVTL